MDITVQKAVSSSRTYEKQLANLLAASNVSYAQLEETLASICTACSTALLQDFESASAQHAETRLWDNHQKVNNYYRSALLRLKGVKEKESVTVAQRKLESSYMKFIKTAQKFYRGYIQGLSLTYGNIPELERVARQTKPRPNAAKANPANILLSCHATLIHLGDLSRYRETELNQDRKKNWAPAVGFYDLAISVLPSSGLSYNQLAVIALADGSLFRATYQLYRALSTENPHPQAEANLRRAFFKITNAWKDGSLNDNEITTAGAGLPNSLISWYLRLLSMYYHGVSFPERDEIENEVINQLDVDMRKKQKSDPPHRMTKINIAAGQAAQDRLLKSETATEENMNSYLYFLRLNIRTFTTFLRVLLDELRAAIDGNELVDPINKRALTDRINPVMRRVLPALRLYCFWLYKNVAILAKPIDASFSTLQEQLWATYAKCLSAATQVFPSEHLSAADYLLEEDEDTIGFKPLTCKENREVWYNDDKMKARWHDVAENTRDINMEMLSRITGFVVVGLRLAMDKQTPIVLDDSSCNFFYQPSTEQPLEIPNGENKSEKHVVPASAALPQSQLPSEENDSLLHADFEAQRMVDNIVGTDEIVAETMMEPSTSMRSLHSVVDTNKLPTFSSYNLSKGISSSRFPVGTHTAIDLLEAVQNYSQKNKSSAEAKHSVPAFPGLGIDSDIPSGPQSPGITQQPILSPSLGAPFSDRLRTPQQTAASSRPGTGLRTSPLLQSGQGHSRMNSNDSNSSALIADATWSSYHPTGSIGTATARPQRRSLYGDRGLGNGTFGDLSFRRESTHDGRIESAFGSPNISSTSVEAWGRASGSNLGLTGSALDVNSSTGQAYSPQWNMMQSSVWGNASGATTPAAAPSSRHMSRDFAGFSRPLT